jgi:hypothetical protein
MAKATDNHTTDGKAKADRKTPAPAFPTMSAAEVSYANELAQLGYDVSEESVIRYAIQTSDPDVDPHTITERDIQKKVYDEMNRREAARAPSQAYRIGQPPAAPSQDAAEGHADAAAEQPGDDADALARIGQLEKQLKELDTDFKTYSTEMEKEFNKYMEDTGEELADRNQEIERLREENTDLQKKLDTYEPKKPKPPEGPGEGKQVTIGGARKPKTVKMLKSAENQTQEKDFDFEIVPNDYTGTEDEVSLTEAEVASDLKATETKTTHDYDESGAHAEAAPASKAAAVSREPIEQRYERLKQLAAGLPKDALDKFDIRLLNSLELYRKRGYSGLKDLELANAAMLSLEGKYASKPADDAASGYTDEYGEIKGGGDEFSEVNEEFKDEDIVPKVRAWNEALVKAKKKKALTADKEYTNVPDSGAFFDYMDAKTADAYVVGIDEESKEDEGGFIEEPPVAAEPKKTEWMINRGVYERYEGILKKYYKEDQDGSVVLSATEKELDGLVAQMNEVKEPEDGVVDESPYNPNFVPPSAYDSYSGPKESRFGPKAAVPKAAQKPVPKATEKPVPDKTVQLEVLEVRDWNEADGDIEPPEAAQSVVIVPSKSAQELEMPSKKTAQPVKAARKKTPKEIMLEDDEKPEEGKGKSGSEAGRFSSRGTPATPTPESEPSPKIPLKGEVLTHKEAKRRNEDVSVSTEPGKKTTELNITGSFVSDSNIRVPDDTKTTVEDSVVDRTDLPPDTKLKGQVVIGGKDGTSDDDTAALKAFAEDQEQKRKGTDETPTAVEIFTKKMAEAGKDVTPEEEDRIALESRVEAKRLEREKTGRQPTMVERFLENQAAKPEPEGKPEGKKDEQPAEKDDEGGMAGGFRKRMKKKK